VRRAAFAPPRPSPQHSTAAGWRRCLSGSAIACWGPGRADGRSQASPVAFVVSDGAFWIATDEELRLRNLRATPLASVVVMEGTA
jgi:hypothetical protein